MLTFTKLVAALTKNYKFTEPVETATAASVKAFIAKENINAFDGDTAIDVDALFKAHTSKPLDLSDDEDDKAAAQQKAHEAESARRTKAARVLSLADEDNSPQRFSIGNIERKAYAAKVARGEASCVDADSAEICGAWLRKAFCALHNVANPHSKTDNEVLTKANVTYDFASGGWTIPEILSTNLIEIRQKFSALLELVGGYVNILPQGESIPRVAGDHTVYSTSEGVALTESNAAGDQVRMTPFSMDVLATVTKKLLASSAINFGDATVRSMAWAKDKKLEQIFFNGDASSTYFNQLGIIGQFRKIVTDAGGTWTAAAPTNAAYAAGAVVAAGNSWGAITYANLMETFGRPAMLQNQGPVKFSCSRPFFWNVMIPLMEGRGGTTREEVANGMARPVFQGVPGVYTNALTQASVAADVPLIVGEFDTALKVGVVPELTEISTSTEAYWVQRKQGFMFSMYHAINVHDIGNANSTAASRTPGPLACLVVPA